MKRLVTLAILVSVVAAFGGCSEDAATPADAASFKGSWKLSSVSSTTAVTDGALVLGDSDYALAIAEPLGGTLTTYTLAGDGKSLTLRDGTTVPFTLTSEPKLMLTLPGGAIDGFTPDTAPALSEISVKGTITAPATAPTYTAPRAALIFLTRNSVTGETEFGNDPRLDQPITFASGKASFDFELMREALGTERIVFGPVQTGIAIGLVVAYNDRDGTGKLEKLFQACPSATSEDCILGVSALWLGFRNNSSAELSASPYAYLHEGWSNAVAVTDARSAQTKTGLVSLNVATTLPYDVTLWDDPTQHTVTKLDLTVPVTH